MLASWVPIPWAGYKRGLRRKLESRGCYHHCYMSLDNPPKLVSALRSISPLADFYSFAPRAWRRAAHDVGRVWLAESAWWAAGGTLFMLMAR